eukprot:CAMPEP_0119006580 /NCGR_PEP_ID=MMETSP1176-20130426/2387_1 /TAXON_ID=265551 /ORGANISM="Synedropsis recta cf, Strain CCMP1620" /LENGTH=75 /DNA_ID=CAMNT_0006958511 /DNA_START=128 /DNA_END=355 /DNA_ORIENTATION=-
MTKTQYEDLDWKDLPDDVKEAATVLGYKKSIWNGDGKVAADEKDWIDLSTEEQAAATKLGYNEVSWEEEGCCVIL